MKKVAQTKWSFWNWLLGSGVGNGPGPVEGHREVLARGGEAEYVRVFGKKPR